jgi:hypothetical protein
MIQLYYSLSHFLLQYFCLHCLAAIQFLDSWPGNIPGPCRLLPCVMRPAGQPSLPQAVGFRCAHCSGEFDTRHAIDCHRRKQSSLGTGCADPSNSKSVSFTGRASFSSSIVREHDFLGAFLYIDSCFHQIIINIVLLI